MFGTKYANTHLIGVYTVYTYKDVHTNTNTVTETYKCFAVFYFCLSG